MKPPPIYIQTPPHQQKSRARWAAGEPARQAARTRAMAASIAELRAMEAAYGDAGTIAFILGEPVEDVQRIMGS